MLKGFFAILMLIGYGAAAQTFSDNFNGVDNSKWFYDFVGAGTFDYNKGLTVRVQQGAVRSSYSNAAVYTKHQFHNKRMDLWVNLSEKSKGSTGWGFWNGEMNPVRSTIVWFIYLESDENYPLNGFFAVVKRFGSGPEFIPLDTDILNSSHKYSIDWTNTGISFYVDDKIVARSDQAVATPMRIHIWKDNAVYDPSTFAPVFQDVNSNANLTVSKLTVQ